MNGQTTPPAGNGDKAGAKPEEQKAKAKELLVEKGIVAWDLKEDTPEIIQISEGTGLSSKEIIGIAGWLRCPQGKEWTNEYLRAQEEKKGGATGYPSGVPIGAPQTPSGVPQRPSGVPTTEKHPPPTQNGVPQVPSGVKPKMAEEEWLPEAYRRLDGILTQMRGVRGLSPGRVETVKELVKNNPEMYLNPQGLTQLLQGIQVNPFQIPLVVTHTFGGATPQFQPVVYPQQQNMPQFIPQPGYPQQQGFVPQSTPQQGQEQGYGGFATERSLSKDEVMGMVIEIIKARDKDRALEESKMLAQSKDRELEAIRKKLEAFEKGSGAHSNNKELEAIRKKLEAFEKGSGALDKKPSGGLSEERLVEILDGRDVKSKENKDKNALVQTLDGIRQALDNLHGRVSTMEQGGVPGKYSEGADAGWDKKILNAAGNKLINLLEKGEATEEKLRAFAKELKPSLPPGTRSEFDMRVEQAQHEADARKTEALERRRGFEALAGGIRDGFQGLGFNVGAGLSAGPAGVTPSPTQSRIIASSEPQLPIRGADGQRYVNCPRCHNPLVIPEGQARVMCSLCNEIINIMTHEEGLKQKISAEKSETPETKAEVKKKELEREEEKPPEAEKPESVEEKPSAEAKPEEKSKGELDVKATETAEGVTA